MTKPPRGRGLLRSALLGLLVATLSLLVRTLFRARVKTVGLRFRRPRQVQRRRGGLHRGRQHRGLRPLAGAGIITHC
jgi:hypothetical protein